MDMKRFEYLEHTADAEFIAYGRTVDEAFENSALAMASLMVDPATVSASVEKDVELTGDALDMLLYDWLSELLYIFEVDRLVFGRFGVHVTEGGEYSLKAKVWGESIEKHPDVFLHIKAVTFHGLRFEKRNNIYEAQVVLDI
ncbi:archease family protein [Methanocella conradii HZ254]|uniref:Protein archease n=1 Tax=Methanocella conradii (strain DSM 24694 / JCM 17849 / CGMCC 1.5162 / HZ254) TaxID=1041930 RepID=H8I7A8_METCZ|nr:archease family protein [Methanocella conradii HZ254]